MNSIIIILMSFLMNYLKNILHILLPTTVKSNSETLANKIIFNVAVPNIVSSN